MERSVRYSMCSLLALFCTQQSSMGQEQHPATSAFDMWYHMISLNGIEDNQLYAMVEDALDYIQTTYTGQAMFQELSCLLDNDSLFAYPDSLETRMIQFTDDIVNSGTCLEIDYSDETDKTQGLAINININQFRLAGYRHNNTTIPFSIEQAIVHELGHVVEELTEEENSSEQKRQYEHKQMSYINSQINFYFQEMVVDSTFRVLKRQEKALLNIDQDLSFDTEKTDIQRYQLYKEWVLLADSLVATERSIYQSEIAHPYREYQQREHIKEKMDSINEAQAMEWENRFLAEHGLPERMVYMVPEMFFKKIQDEFITVFQQQQYVSSFDNLEKADMGFKPMSLPAVIPQ